MSATPERQLLEETECIYHETKASEHKSSREGVVMLVVGVEACLLGTSPVYSAPNTFMSASATRLCPPPLYEARASVSEVGVIKHTGVYSEYI